MSKVRIGVVQIWPEVGCEIGGLRNIGMVVRALKMGECVSEGM